MDRAGDVEQVTARVRCEVAPQLVGPLDERDVRLSFVLDPADDPRAPVRGAPRVGDVEPLDAEDVRRYLDEVLSPLWTVMPSRDFYFRGLEIQKRYGFGFYDSLILSAALEAGCTRLYSEDLQHGQRIGNLVVESPFLGDGENAQRKI